MERPRFCSLLSFGTVLCWIGVAIGAIVCVVGCSSFQANRDFAIINLVVGTSLIAQSLVSLGVLKVLLWIVDRLIEQVAMPAKQAESASIPMELPEIEERDGIRNKPVLKRRQF